MQYTVAQLHAFIKAVDRQESKQLASLLTVIAAGSQGTNDTITKIMKQLSC